MATAKGSSARPAADDPRGADRWRWTPGCSEMWPGNTADVTSLVPVIDRLRRRFAIGRVCIVADRGMISAEAMPHMEARGLPPTSSACASEDRQLVRDIPVLNDAGTVRAAHRGKAWQGHRIPAPRR